VPSLDPLIDRVLACVRSAERGGRAAVLSADVLEVADDLRRAAAATQARCGNRGARERCPRRPALGAISRGSPETDGDLGIALTLFESLLTVRPDLIPVPVLHALVAASAPALILHGRGRLGRVRTVPQGIVITQGYRMATDISGVCSHVLDYRVGIRGFGVQVGVGVILGSPP